MKQTPSPDVPGGAELGWEEDEDAREGWAECSDVIPAELSLQSHPAEAASHKKGAEQSLPALLPPQRGLRHTQSSSFIDKNAGNNIPTARLCRGGLLR